MPLAPKPTPGGKNYAADPPDLSDSQMKALREWWIWLYRMAHAGEGGDHVGDDGLYFFGKPTDPDTPPPEQWSWFFDPKAPWNSYDERLRKQGQIWDQHQKERAERGYPRALFPPDPPNPGAENSPVMPAEPGPPPGWQDMFGSGTPLPPGVQPKQPKFGQDGKVHPTSAVAPAVAAVAASLYTRMKLLNPTVNAAPGVHGTPV